MTDKELKDIKGDRVFTAIEKPNKEGSAPYWYKAVLWVAVLTFIAAMVIATKNSFWVFASILLLAINDD